MKKPILFIALFFFVSIGLVSQFQYPEFFAGKTVIDGVSVKTSYGILSSSFISANDRNYALWKLREGSINGTLLLALSDEWSMKIGTDFAVLPVNQEDMIERKYSQILSFYDAMFNAAKEALTNAPKHRIHFEALYYLLAGKKLPEILEKESPRLRIAQWGDPCDRLYDGCMDKNEKALKTCLDICKTFPEKEREKCRLECMKGYDRRIDKCLDAWLKCKQTRKG